MEEERKTLEDFRYERGEITTGWKPIASGLKICLESSLSCNTFLVGRKITTHVKVDLFHTTNQIGSHIF